VSIVVVGFAVVVVGTVETEVSGRMLVDAIMLVVVGFTVVVTNSVVLVFITGGFTQPAINAIVNTTRMLFFT